MTRTDEVKTETLFTPESANRALPYVKAVVEDMIDACNRIRAAEESRSKSGAPLPGAAARDREEARRQADDARRLARADLQRVTRELEAVGVEVKDPETGLLDFPGEIDGRRVYLCWKRGEEKVAYWHDLETGFRGRRPIPGASGPGVAGPPSAPGTERAPR
jgi:hypothetical protein